MNGDVSAVRQQHQEGLLGEFFVDGLDELSEVEGFFEDAAGAEEFCNVKEVFPRAHRSWR